MFGVFKFVQVRSVLKSDYVRKQILFACFSSAFVARGGVKKKTVIKFFPKSSMKIAQRFSFVTP